MGNISDDAQQSISSDGRELHRKVALREENDLPKNSERLSSMCSLELRNEEELAASQLTSS